MKNTDIKFLKFFVYMLGFVLMFATVFLTYMVYKRSFTEIVAVNDEKSKCGNVNLETNGRIQDVAFSGANIAITTRDLDGKISVTIYDSCNGNVVNTLTIEEKKHSNVFEHRKPDDEERNERDVLS